MEFGKTSLNLSLSYSSSGTGLSLLTRAIKEAPMNEGMIRGINHYQALTEVIL